MPLARNSVSGWLLLSAIVAIALAPLANLTDAWLTALMYTKFAVLIAATFLARFGRGQPAAWWFGFAAIGWSSILVSVPGLWNGVDSVLLAPRLDLSDLSDSLAVRVAEAMGVGSGPVQVSKLSSVVSAWFTFLSAIAGGTISLALELRHHPQSGRAGRSQESDTASPL